VAVAGYSSFVVGAYHKTAVQEQGDVVVVVARIGAVQEYWVEDQPAGLQKVQLALDQVGGSRSVGHCCTGCWKEQHLGMHPAFED
jgi:hypothetical protein